MTWSKKSGGNPIDPDYVIWEETVTTKSGSITWSSAFYPPAGKDYQVLCNVDATNLSSSTHPELFVAAKSGDTFRRHPNKQWFNATTMAIDAAAKIGFRNVSLHGQDSVVKFKFPTGGGAVKIQVIIGAKPITE